MATAAAQVLLTVVLQLAKKKAEFQGDLEVFMTPLNTPLISRWPLEQNGPHLIRKHPLDDTCIVFDGYTIFCLVQWHVRGVTKSLSQQTQTLGLESLCCLLDTPTDAIRSYLAVVIQQSRINKQRQTLELSHFWLWSPTKWQRSSANFSQWGG